jgi:hypothetical protein
MSGSDMFVVFNVGRTVVLLPFRFSKSAPCLAVPDVCEWHYVAVTKCLLGRIPMRKTDLSSRMPSTLTKEAILHLIVPQLRDSQRVAMTLNPCMRFVVKKLLWSPDP